MSPISKRSFRVLQVLSIFAAAVVLLLFLTPLFINTDPIRQKIQSDLSRRIGGPVRFQKLKFTVLPRPSVALYQVIYLLPGKTGGRIEQLRIYPDVSGLFSGKLRISQIWMDTPVIWMNQQSGPQQRLPRNSDIKQSIIPVLSALQANTPTLTGDIRNGTFFFLGTKGNTYALRKIKAHLVSSPGALHVTMKSGSSPWGEVSLHGNFFFSQSDVTVTDLSGTVGTTSISDISARLDVSELPYLKIFSGKAKVPLHETQVLLSSFNVPGMNTIKKINGSLAITSLTYAGPPLDPVAGKFEIAGRLTDFFLDAVFLKGPVKISTGSFKLDQTKLSFSHMHAGFMDSTLTATGTVKNPLGNIHEAEIDFSGTLGPQAAQSLSPYVTLPSQIKSETSFTVSGAHLSWRKKRDLSFKGSFNIKNGPSISLAMHRDLTELAIKRLQIQDRDSNVVLSFTSRKDALELQFTGTLAQSTVNSVLAKQLPGQGVLKGKFTATIFMKSPGASAVQGAIRGSNFVIPWGLNPPAEIKSMDLEASGKSLLINSSTITWNDKDFNLHGKLNITEQGLLADVDLLADGLEMKELQQVFARPKEKRKPFKLPITGTVRLVSKYFNWGKYTFSPVRANISLAPDGLRATITEAEICGILCAGNFGVNPDGFGVFLTPVAANQQLEPEIGCLFGRNVRMTGTFYLVGEITTKGKGKELLSSMDGDLTLVSKKGQIREYPLLAQIFSVLSVLEIIRGKLPNLGERGFDYSTMNITVVIQNGNLLLEKAYIAGSSIDIVAEGSIDLVSQKVNMTVLVAPFSTLNWLMRHIPVLGKILGGTIISIPIEVSGDLKNPNVILMSPEAVGSRILNLMKNILELPVEIFRR